MTTLVFPHVLIGWLHCKYNNVIRIYSMLQNIIYKFFSCVVYLNQRTVHLKTDKKQEENVLKGRKVHQNSV